MLLAVTITAILVGVVLMVVGMLSDVDWVFVTGVALALGALLTVLGWAFIQMWLEALGGTP